MVEFFAALSQKPMCREEIKEHVGIVQATVTRWINLCRRKNLVKIAFYRYHGTLPVAYYCIGHPFEDAIKPRRKTSAEHSKNWRNRKKKKLELEELKKKEGLT